MQVATEEILARKAGEIQQQLEAWLQAENVLRPGEELIFSLRIERSNSLVRRDPHDQIVSPAPIKISGQSLAPFKGELIRPAQLSQEDTQELLRKVPCGQVYDQLKKLLVENNNSGTRIYDGVRTTINRVLQTHLDGKYYRLMAGSDGSQLWEIKPK